MKFISDLKAFIYPEETVSQVVGSAIESNNSGKSKILWFIITGIFIIGCSYLNYKYCCSLVKDDD